MQSKVTHYRQRLWWTVLASFCTLGSAASSSVAVAAPPNLVLFVADDLSPDLGCYGNQVVQTPHIDRLAEESTLFRFAYATTASCSASRSVILTGLHNHANGQFGHTHAYHHFVTQPWVQSLPVLLKRLGYHTMRVGKYHVAPESVYAFDQVVEANERNPVEMAERCRGFLAEESASPFFLYVATGDPHRGGGVATELPLRPDRFGNPPPGKSHQGHTPVTYNPAEVVVPSFLPDTPACRAELAQYYQSVSRVDQGVGHLRAVLEETGNWDNTLLIITSDHGMAFAGAKTTVYEAGLRIPMIVRHPQRKIEQGVQSDAMVSLLDITPTLIDAAGGLDRETGRVKGLAEKKWEWKTYAENEGETDGVETGRMEWLPYTFHGKSFLDALGKEHAASYNSVTASHTFHEIQMYYPMRVYQDRKYKIIWNLAHGLPYPFASDLWKSPTWQHQYQLGEQANYGFRSVREVMHHPEFELFDRNKDPDETTNLANDPAHQGVLRRYREKLQQFQSETGDPWMLKWKYE